MAVNVYSTEFISASGSLIYSYVCPPGFVALISCIDVYVGLVAANGNFTAVGEVGQVFWSQGYSFPGEQYSAWRGKHVLTPGQAFAVKAGDAFDCSAAGDLLTLP